MALQDRLNVVISWSSPLVKWSDGVLDLEVDDSGQAQGELRLDMYEEPVPLTGTAADGLIKLEGKNDKASFDARIIHTWDDHTGDRYVGGVVDVLEYRMQEWAPHVIQGYGVTELAAAPDSE